MPVQGPWRASAASEALDRARACARVVPARAKFPGRHLWLVSYTKNKIARRFGPDAWHRAAPSRFLRSSADPVLAHPYRSPAQAAPMWRKVILQEERSPAETAHAR